MRVALIGFMGAGKSSVAKILAQALNYKVLELDQILIDNSEFQTIAELIDTKGEPYFRELERKTLLSILEQDSCIISTGGGIVMNPQNIEDLRAKNCLIIFLKTDFTAILSRTAGNQNRPLLRDKVKAAELFELRQKLYETAANFVVDTSKLTINEVVQVIIEKIKENDLY